jgi:glycosyltransferase involved in cell wall biosynthesis
VHISALVENPGHVCCRYRLRAFQPFFQHAGHELSLHPLPHGWWQRLKLAEQLPSRSILIQRRLLPAWENSRLRHRAESLFFDFDDALWLRDSFSGRALRSVQRERRFIRQIRQVSHIIAGNRFLAEHARRYVPSERVRVVPTCVDPARYPLAPHAEDHLAQLVWIGSASTFQGLERQRELLDLLGRRFPNVSLKIICNRFPAFRRLRVIACPWSEQTEAADLAAADIGIAWMPDDDWSRGKCGLKVLQYMAAGLPVIANPVGVHIEMIRDGENGLLVSTPAEWVDAVEYLSRHSEVRRRMGLAGRARVEKDYSVARGAALWIDILQQAAKSRQAA